MPKQMIKQKIYGLTTLVRGFLYRKISQDLDDYRVLTLPFSIFVLSSTNHVLQQWLQGKIVRLDWIKFYEELNQFEKQTFKIFSTVERTEKSVYVHVSPSFALGGFFPAFLVDRSITGLSTDTKRRMIQELIKQRQLLDREIYMRIVDQDVQILVRKI